MVPARALPASSTSSGAPQGEPPTKVLIPILGSDAPFSSVRAALAYQDGQFHRRPSPRTRFRLRRIRTRPFSVRCRHVQGPAKPRSRRNCRASSRRDRTSAEARGDAESTATRAREKEVVKRRLSASGIERHRSAHLSGSVASSTAPPATRSFDRLDRLRTISRTAATGWRRKSQLSRFFDVNQLAALRMEDRCSKRCHRLCSS